MRLLVVLMVAVATTALKIAELIVVRMDAVVIIARMSVAN